MKDLVTRKLEMIVSGNQDQPITGPGEHPPCFESVPDYHDWLDACDHAERTGVALPPRRSWPKEPNYCYECSPEHRNRMRREGRCLFPNTIFVTEGEGEDEELVGVEG